MRKARKGIHPTVRVIKTDGRVTGFVKQTSGRSFLNQETSGAAGADNVTTRKEWNSLGNRMRGKKEVRYRSGHRKTKKTIKKTFDYSGAKSRKEITVDYS